MDVCVRHCRDGRLPDSTTAASCCVFDHLKVIGGPHLFQQALQDYLLALRQGRCQAIVVRLACLASSVSDLVDAQHLGRSCLDVLDLYSDPWGWNQPEAQLRAGSVSHGLQLTCSLEQLEEQLTAPAPLAAVAAPSSSGSGSGNSSSSRVAVVIDCCSTLMERYGTAQALALLERLQRHASVSCLLTTFHQDLHDERALFAMQRLSSCLVEVAGLTPLQRELAARASGRWPTGRLDCKVKRRTGRLKAESRLYTVNADGSLEFFGLPPGFDAFDPRALLNLAPPAAAAAQQATQLGPGPAGAGVAQQVVTHGSASGQAAPGVAADPMQELARAVGSTMRLTLTEQERQAKERVVLPYQQVAAGSGGSSSGSAAAGGAAPASGVGPERPLGHILYVRDSDNEHDSDEDPDDDLDI